MQLGIRDVDNHCSGILSAGFGRLPIMNKLEKFVSTALPAGPQLPLTHITKVANARTVFENGELRTSHCPVLNEELLYFFYGKAEYRTRGNKASDLPGEKPVCFVCRSVNDGDVFTTFPFDSGAFYLSEGIKELYFPHVEDVLDLSLGNTMSSIQKLVTKFFGDNDQYIENEVQRLNIDPLFDLEAAAYIQLLLSGGLSILDGRSTTPELVIHEPVSLNKVDFIVAPVQMQKSLYFITQCSNYSIVPIYYHIKSPLMPREYISVIQEKIHDLI